MLRTPKRSFADIEASYSRAHNVPIEVCGRRASKAHPRRLRLHSGKPGKFCVAASSVRHSFAVAVITTVVITVIAGVSILVIFVHIVPPGALAGGAAGAFIAVVFFGADVFAGGKFVAFGGLLRGPDSISLSKNSLRWMNCAASWSP